MSTPPPPARVSPEGYIAQRILAEVNPQRPWLLSYLEAGNIAVMTLADQSVADWPMLTLADSPPTPMREGDPCPDCGQSVRRSTADGMLACPGSGDAWPDPQ